MKLHKPCLYLQIYFPHPLTQTLAFSIHSSTEGLMKSVKYINMLPALQGTSVQGLWLWYRMPPAARHICTPGTLPAFFFFLVSAETIGGLFCRSEGKRWHTTQGFQARSNKSIAPCCDQSPGRGESFIWWDDYRCLRTHKDELFLMCMLVLLCAIASGYKIVKPMKQKPVAIWRGGC